MLRVNKCPSLSQIAKRHLIWYSLDVFHLTFVALESQSKHVPLPPITAIAIVRQTRRVIPLVFPHTPARVHPLDTGYNFCEYAFK